MPVTYQDSIDIDAPADAAFAVWADVEHWPQWTASVTRVDRLGPGPLAPGERVRIRQPRLPTLVWTVIELVPGRSFSWSSASPGVRSVAAHELAPRPDGGCTATLRLTQTGPLAGVGALLLSGLTRRYLRLEAEGLKRRTESRADAVGH